MPRVLPSRGWEATTLSPSEPRGPWGLWQEPRPQSDCSHYSIAYHSMAPHGDYCAYRLVHYRIVESCRLRIDLTKLGLKGWVAMRESKFRGCKLRVSGAMLCLGLTSSNIAAKDRRDPRRVRTSFRPVVHTGFTLNSECGLFGCRRAHVLNLKPKTKS